MSISSPFIRRPVGTTLLTLAIALAGALAYTQLPVSPLPQVEFPTISVSAALPGASPETMASAVATPLERQFGRIAGVSEMTSSSSLGSTSITLQFDLTRNVDAAARDVQAAINAARGQLPTNLPSNPTYRKVNPSDAPIMILSLLSETYGRARMYDVAATILQQKLSQVEGVGQVNVGGGALPAVRADVNPTLVNNLGLALSDVRTGIGAANANSPKGSISGDDRAWSIAANDQLSKADEYEKTIISYHNGAAVRLADVAAVTDGVEDTRTAGLVSLGTQQPPVLRTAISLILFRQPGANIIETVDRVRALLPQLQAAVPAGMDLEVSLDRTTTIRASVQDVQFTLVLSIALVILVVFVFLRNVRTTLIPSVAVPVSLLGTFGVMYLCGYSVDNLSLMAMTIATGFVVDDAIVVIENITRHIEDGMTPVKAAFKGAREIGFTVVSISLSLVAVFIPILLMGGVVGRLFREFAVVLSVAVGVSMVISLTTTPMMCAVLLKGKGDQRHGRIYRFSEWVFDKILLLYEVTLRGALRFSLITLAVAIGTVVLTGYLLYNVPKDFFPQQDTGRLTGAVKADQNVSFAQMQKLLTAFATAVAEDPAVEGVIATAGGGGGPGGGTANTARMFVSLVPLEKRGFSADQIINGTKKPDGTPDRIGLTARVSKIPGATLFFQSVQDVRVGGRASNAQYQYTLQGDNFDELTDWAPKILNKLKSIPGLTAVDIDQQNKGLQARLTIDRATAKRYDISAQQIDSALYDLFGQRQVSTYYTQANQYHVVMEADPKFAQDPSALKNVYLKAASGAQVPLSTFVTYKPDTTALSINHQGQFPAITISFNLQPGFSLGQAVDAIHDTEREIALPTTIHGTFAGTAQAFQSSLATLPVLILAAILTVYIVLGVLYESFVHPITILSTLPSAGLGALLALMLFNTPLTLIAVIGLILLIGIVKKNAIMMIDFALNAERNEGKSPEEAIYQACVLRFRPITMTTLAALFGGLPLALGKGVGAELRQPLGIAIVGGLIVSQMLTLYTTPVIYLYMDRMRLWFLGGRQHNHTMPAIGMKPKPAI